MRSLPQPSDRVPKILGADVELANFLEGIDLPGGTGFAASRGLLREIDGVPSRNRRAGEEPSHATEWGRKFLPTCGGCAYIDSDHLEIALPETASAHDHVAYWRGMLAVARTAMAQLNRRLPPGCRAQVLANCSDGLGNAYGSHVNVLLTRAAWENIIHRRPHYLAYLAAFQISSIVYTGQGKVGGEHGRDHAGFQLSQRADFFEILSGLDTMVHRGVVNTRDEPLCGDDTAAGQPLDPALARLHVIFYDSTLSQVATLLRAGTLQMVVAMIEAGWVDAELSLDDPLDALARWSGDPSLGARARTTGGNDVTAVELQFDFLEEAKRFGDAGGFDGIVPRAAELLALWEDTLAKLRRRDFDELGRRLDWVLKRQMLQRVMAGRPHLTWASAELKHLDQIFASLEEDDGPFWAYERSGQVDRVVSDDDIAFAIQHPPEDTRAWTRTQLLRRADRREVHKVDWDSVHLDVSGVAWGAGPRVVTLPDPSGSTRAANAAIFDGHRSLNEIADALHASTGQAAGRVIQIVPQTYRYQ